MPAPHKTYDLKTVYLTIGGFRLEGAGDDAFLSFEMASDDVEDSVGADGQVTSSRTNDERVYADITVRENSLAAKTLGDLQLAQAAAPTILPLAFLMVDGQTGEQVSSQYTVFKTSPGPSKAKAVGNRVWRVLLPNAKRLIKYAPAIAQ